MCSFLLLVSPAFTTDFTRQESITRRRFWDRHRLSIARVNSSQEHTDIVSPKRKYARPTTIASIHRNVARATASAISTLGFVTSVSIGLLSTHANFGKLRPTVEAMQLYLEETGISKELSKSFTTKLFDNLVILWRIQKQYRETHDLRDTVALKRNIDLIPSMEEASR